MSSGFYLYKTQHNLHWIIHITLLIVVMCQKCFLLMQVSSVSPLCAADRWFPGCVVVSQHPLLSLLRVHLPPHADQPAHPLRLHAALLHQPLQDMLLQIPFLAPQAAGQSTQLPLPQLWHVCNYSLKESQWWHLIFGATSHTHWERLKMCLITELDKWDTVKVHGYTKTNVCSCEPAVMNASEGCHKKMNKMQTR